MKNKHTQKWIPLYIDKWIFGSTRIELEPDERGVFVDLICLGAKDNGYIRANEELGYLPRQLAGLLNISEELLKRTIDKCIKYRKLEEKSNGIYYLKNWEKYQFSRYYKWLLENEEKENVYKNVNSVYKNVNNTLRIGNTILYNIREDNIIKYNNNIQTSSKTEDVSCECIDNSVNIDKNEEKSLEIAYNEENNKMGNDIAIPEEKAKGRPFPLKTKGKKDKLVNWDNAKTDLQRFIAYWVKLDNPNLYKTATTEQIKGIYGRFAKATKDILSIAGDLETAKETAKMCREWLKSKNLDYTLETISKHLPKFLEKIKRDDILPPEIDTALWEEYCELRERKKGKFDKKKIISFLKNAIITGKNVNKLLENKIIELKRDNSDVPDIIKEVVNKYEEEKNK